MYLGSLKFNIYSGKTVFKVELYAAFFMFVATTVVSIGEFMLEAFMRCVKRQSRKQQ